MALKWSLREGMQVGDVPTLVKREEFVDAGANVEGKPYNLKKM